jgi:hypothetical protein
MPPGLEPSATDQGTASGAAKIFNLRLNHPDGFSL